MISQGQRPTTFAKNVFRGVFLTEPWIDDVHLTVGCLQSKMITNLKNQIQKPLSNWVFFHFESRTVSSKKAVIHELFLSLQLAFLLASLLQFSEVSFSHTIPLCREVVNYSTVELFSFQHKSVCDDSFFPLMGLEHEATLHFRIH